MITTTNMKLGLVLVAVLIQGAVAASKNSKYASVARIKAIGKAAHKVKHYTLTLDPTTIKLRMPMSSGGNRITNLEFEIGHDGNARRLGSGMNGGVFAGRLSTTNRAPIRVAIKIGDRHKFSNEAKHMERLNNPAINKCYASGLCVPPAHDNDDYPRQVVVIELVKGKSLNSYLKANALTRQASISILHQIANALEYMWAQGLVHNDLANTKNVMIVENRDNYQVVLIDFGLTQTFEECYEKGKNSNSDYDMAMDLMKLKAMCQKMGLSEHAKLVPSEIARSKIQKASHKAWRYIQDLDFHPELYAKHLMYSDDHPARGYLPGLLGYAVCSECRGLGNLAEQMSGDLRCQACADLRKRVSDVDHRLQPFQLSPAEARSQRVYVAILHWKHANNTQKRPEPTDLKQYVNRTDFQRATRDHPAFRQDREISLKDIWQYMNRRLVAKWTCNACGKETSTRESSCLSCYQPRC
jgi:tRNA A-37 threonylcarbamoyl transferase component Bud32